MPETVRADATDDLFEAITSGDPNRVADLLDQQPTLANHPNDGGISPLLMATYAQRADIADLLLARGADLDLYAAAARGDAEQIAALLAASPTLATATSPDGWTAPSTWPPTSATPTSSPCS